MRIIFDIPPSTGLIETFSHRVTIEGIKRIWNRRIVWLSLFPWILMSIMIQHPKYSLLSIDSIILYVILFFGYFGSFDKYIIIEGNHDSGWHIKELWGNSLIYFIRRSEMESNPKVDIIVYSMRPKALAWVEINNEKRLKIRNPSVKKVREYLDIVNINNNIVPYTSNQ